MTAKRYSEEEWEQIARTAREEGRCLIGWQSQVYGGRAHDPEGGQEPRYAAWLQEMRRAANRHGLHFYEQIEATAVVFYMEPILGLEWGLWKEHPLGHEQMQKFREVAEILKTLPRMDQKAHREEQGLRYVARLYCADTETDWFIEGVEETPEGDWICYCIKREHHWASWTTDRLSEMVRHPTTAGDVARRIVKDDHFEPGCQDEIWEQVFAMLAEARAAYQQEGLAWSEQRRVRAAQEPPEGRFWDPFEGKWKPGEAAMSLEERPEEWKDQCRRLLGERVHERERLQEIRSLTGWSGDGTPEGMEATLKSVVRLAAGLEEPFRDLLALMDRHPEPEKRSRARWWLHDHLNRALFPLAEARTRLTEEREWWAQSIEEWSALEPGQDWAGYWPEALEASDQNEITRHRVAMVAQVLEWSRELRDWVARLVAEMEGAAETAERLGDEAKEKVSHWLRGALWGLDCARSDLRWADYSVWDALKEVQGKDQPEDEERPPVPDDADVPAQGTP